MLSKVKEVNDCHGTKRMITMNAIQAKMQKRKQKGTKLDRSSIMMFPTNKSIDKFKEDLNKSLKV
jgi:hypothetical protein